MILLDGATFNVISEVMENKSGRPLGTFKNPVRKTHPIYRTWADMKQRCLNPRSAKWASYGGRGIKVCERWSGPRGFKNFYEDMSAGWREGLTIERRENDGNYEPGNCCWVTQSAQTKNRRSTLGSVRNPSSLRQRAIRAGLDYHLVVNRIKIGWSKDQALSVPKMKIGAQYGHNGKRQSLAA